MALACASDTLQNWMMVIHPIHTHPIHTHPPNTPTHPRNMNTIQIRLTSGDTIKGSFQPSHTLADVCLWASSVGGVAPNSELLLPGFPRKYDVLCLCFVFVCCVFLLCLLCLCVVFAVLVCCVHRHHLLVVCSPMLEYLPND